MTQQPLSNSILSSSFAGKLCACILGILLTACSTGPVTDQPEFVTRAPEISPVSHESDIQILLGRAAQEVSPQKEALQLQAAQLLRSIERDNDALLLLETLETDFLPLDLAIDILVLHAQLYADYDQPLLALQLLVNRRMEQLPQLPDFRQMTIRLLRADLYEITGNRLKSAQDRIQVDQLLQLDMVPINHELIWKNLTALEPDELMALAEQERRFEFQGWYELAVIGKAFQHNLDRQLVELARWRSSWIRHPAAVSMPQAMQLVETMAEERPDTIALLLPLNTQSGRVIRDGFMSAYYDVMEIGGKVPTLRFYNTDESNNILDQYFQAVNEGAEMVIGPLLKEHITQLHNQRSLPVPTLALNNLEGSSPLSNSLYQFALSPENESVQIAEKAWQDGHRYAAVLSPEQTTDDFYQRKRDSFINHWLTLGGHIVAHEEFRDNYTTVLEALLDINDSDTRKNRIGDLIREELAFTQRRRQDIDMIFLVSDPGPARQIKPTLAYLYAGDIPVYATQDIYSGLPRPQVDYDLNGIIFGDSPWVLNFNDELKEKATTLFPQNSSLTLRLQAFGIDAFRLYPRLKQLETVPDSQIYGATGLLKLGENHNIIRELSWAQVSEGLAQIQLQAQ
ncbi:MAG: penicillin-binding protein activator [Gammaproteobacteria bacterium]|nr:penicillin-binding protein activator [Gammaproteobacteria bacterium]